MKSLRTDDILGAKPRIRHAPKNIIRQQYINKNQHFHLQPRTMSQLHMSESYHQKSPAGRPYYKKAPYEGYLASLNPHNNIRVGQQYRYPPKYQDHDKIRNNEAKYILPKDAPVVNYQNQIYRKQNQLIRERPTNSKINQQMGNPEKNLQNKYNYRQNSGASRRSDSNPDRSRQGSAKSLQQQKKNIFRGLGFNIITNHKFSYDMENTLKNQTSKWLDYQ